MFYSFCDTEQIINFDGLPFHLVFYKGFEDYLKKEYKLGDDIYLYLVFLFGSNDKQYYYVRDFSLKSPEQQFNDKLEIINTTKKK